MAVFFPALALAFAFPASESDGNGSRRAQRMKLTRSIKLRRLLHPVACQCPTNQRRLVNDIPSSLYGLYSFDLQAWIFAF